jgi:hypothetical protein
MAIITRWHAAGKLMRIRAHALLGLGNGDRAQRLNGPLRGLAPGDPLMRQYRFGNLLADPHHRIQRRHRFLKNHGHPGTAQMAHFAGAGRTQVLAVKQNVAANSGLRRQQPHHRQRGYGFPGTRLAHHPQYFAGLNRQVEFPHRVAFPCRGGEADVQITNLKERRQRARFRGFQVFRDSRFQNPGTLRPSSYYQPVISC